jgi:hypothetical protein
MVFSGCAAYGPGDLRPGMARAEVQASMGPPTLTLPSPGGGTRLVFARGPQGRHTWLVDLDAVGRVAGWRQALGEAQFAQLSPGATEAEVLYAYGPPAQRRARGLRPGSLWSWRYPTNDCLWWQVEFDERGVALGGSYATDPACDPPTRD